MKATYKFILAAFAAAVALSSCTKDIAADRQDTGSQDGLRTISISFGTPTKTVPVPGKDGIIKPEFKDGDTIAISNNEKMLEVRVKVDDGKAYFETDLEGDLIAIYPLKAAVVKEGILTGDVKIPDVQTGLFEDANIARAEIGPNATSAKFINQTAILRFYVGQEIGVNKIVIDAEKKYNLAKPDGIKLNDIQYDRITVELQPQAERRICYVAVDTIGASYFKVKSYTITQTADPETPVERTFKDANLQQSTFTNIFIPYFVKINVGDADNPVIQRWAYCNVGAFLPEDYGYHFSWGNPDGHWLNGKSDNYVFSEDMYNNSKGVDLHNDIDPKTPHDAAFVAWGGDWRMPTAAEFESLKNATNLANDWTYTYPGKDGHNCGRILESKLVWGCKLFFPAAGLVSTSEFQGKDTNGYYLTSTYEDETSIKYLSFYDSGIEIGFTVGLKDRYSGCSIRPIYGQAQPAGNQTLPISVNPYTNGGTL